RGSAPMVYALADRGVRLLIERDGIDFANVEWSRKNRKAGRPFIDHQLEIMDQSFTHIRGLIDGNASGCQPEATGKDPYLNRAPTRAEKPSCGSLMFAFTTFLVTTALRQRGLLAANGPT